MPTRPRASKVSVAGSGTPGPLHALLTTAQKSLPKKSGFVVLKPAVRHSAVDPI